MPTKEKITKEIYLVSKRMLHHLLDESCYFGVGYVIQIIYELLIVVTSYENGSEYAVDRYLRKLVYDYKVLVVARNTVNHNSYNKKGVESAVRELIDSRIVERIYMSVFGEAHGYKIFDAECYYYLEKMKRLWAE